MKLYYDIIQQVYIAEFVRQCPNNEAGMRQVFSLGQCPSGYAYSTIQQRSPIRHRANRTHHHTALIAAPPAVCLETSAPSERRRNNTAADGRPHAFQLMALCRFPSDRIHLILGASPSLPLAGFAGGKLLLLHELERSICGPYPGDNRRLIRVRPIAGA